jgi:hypothetical protein
MPELAIANPVGEVAAEQATDEPSRPKHIEEPKHELLDRMRRLRPDQ